MPVPFKKDPIEFNQRKLLAEDVFDLLDKDHDCFIYEDILSQIDTKSIEENMFLHVTNNNINTIGGVNQFIV